MAKFKTTPLELDNSIPKDLYSIIKNKWHYYLNMEKKIRESTLARVMPKLTKGQITKERKKHGRKFSPKYRAFNILQNNIEDFVNKSTKIWKLIYGLTTMKLGEEDPLEDKDNEEEEENDKEEEEKKELREKIVEETQQKIDKVATVEQKQQEQSVQDTQLPPLSPPHDTSTLAATITVKDISNNSSQNINQLIAEDL